jgi:hypothetical protein
VNRFYDEYELDTTAETSVEPDYILENVEPLFTGTRIAGFIKRTNSSEVAELHRDTVLGYDPNQQRGWRITYRDGVEHKRQYLIKRTKVKEIGQAIAENREYNRIRTANARHGHVGLRFDPYGDQPIGHERGRLCLFRLGQSDGPDSLLTIPDSAHRQEGDKYFTEHIANPEQQTFSPEHAGFSPATYELVMMITLTDTPGEGESHYEHNELITKSSSSRRAFLEGGALSHPNWVAHELLRLNPITKELVEIYETKISTNSPQIVTFSALARGIQDGWKDRLSTSTRATIAHAINAMLTMAREEIPEWGPLPFTQRRAEREQFLYSQAIVQRSMLRIFADWYGLNENDGQGDDWERWRPTLQKLKSTFTRHDFSGHFLSRQNPVFFAEEGGGIYQLNKRARDRKNETRRHGQLFTLNPLGDLTVQNTRLSNDFMCDQLRRFLAYGPDQLSLEHPTLSPLAVAT